MTIERANYIVSFYEHLLPLKQKAALKHLRHSLKLQDLPDSEVRTKLYLRNQWLTDDPEVLNFLDPDYTQSILNIAACLLEEHNSAVFFNNCPQCSRLARTPFAKQCRYCLHDWH